MESMITDVPDEFIQQVKQDVKKYVYICGEENNTHIWGQKYTKRQRTEIIVYIKKGVFDDHKSVYAASQIIDDDKDSIHSFKFNSGMPKYLIRDGDIHLFMMYMLDFGMPDIALVCKNWPKIKSSHYGSLLHDISIVCIND